MFSKFSDCGHSNHSIISEPQIWLLQIHLQQCQIVHVESKYFMEYKTKATNIVDKLPTAA